jgi:nitrogen-specific signal transduction histidine kinase
MKTYNLIYLNDSDLMDFIKKNNIATSKNVLLQFFSGIIEDNFLLSLIATIKNEIPHVKIIGTTTSGEIFEDMTLEKSVVLSFSVFKSTKIYTFSSTLKTTSIDLAKDLINQFPKDVEFQVGISFVDGLNTNGENFIQTFHKYNSNLIIAGGLAGDNSQFQRTIVFTENGIISKGAVIALLAGKNLKTVTQASFGWENIGKTMIVTKSKNNIVYEIDGIKAIDIYAKYLGEDIAKKLPEVGIEFPLIIQKESISIPRAVVGVGENGSLIFAGNLYLGDHVTFGYGNIDSILNFINKINIDKTQAIFIYSCIARKLLLQENVRLELNPFAKIADTVGCFTYGEFFSSITLHNHELLNETMTILGLTEIDDNYEENSKSKISKHIDIDRSYNQTLKALSHLIYQTTSELEDINLHLTERIKEEVEKNLEKKKLIQHQARLAQMGEMISMIAHQWRQPLGAITSALISIESKILLKKYDCTKEEDQNKFFSFLKRKIKNTEEYVKTLSDTIDDFRNFFKPDKKLELISILVPIQKAIKITEASLRNKNISLNLDCRYQNEIEFYSNEMMQVVLNIIKNSEDNFIERKTEKPYIKIKTYYDEPFHCIEIADNGGGISKDIINKIFDPYFSTKHEKNGSGLGLYMSKIMVEQHHSGKLLVKNSDVGAVFTIKLR